MWNTGIFEETSREKIFNGNNTWTFMVWQLLTIKFSFLLFTPVTDTDEKFAFWCMFHSQDLYKY